MGSSARFSDGVLVAALEDLSARLDDPPVPYLATRVRARLEAAPQAPRRLRWSRYAFAGFAVAVAVSMVLAFSPATRDAVAGWLGLRGVTIERGTPRSTVLGGDLDLGEATTLAEAQRQTEFDVLLPRGLGSPDETYLADAPSGGRVDLLYEPGGGLPPAAASGVGMLLTEFRAETGGELIRKGVDDDVLVEAVTVDGSEGVWLEGGIHTVAYTDPDGEAFTDNTRLAGNTLIWERGALTLRLESGLSKEDAVRVARSLVKA